jgi:hypothetical protein
MTVKRRHQIDSDRFSIDNGRLLMDGTSIPFDNITSVNVIKNRDYFDGETLGERLEKREFFGRLSFVLSSALAWIATVSIAAQMSSYFLSISEWIMSFNIFLMILFFILCFIALLYSLITIYGVMYAISRWIFFRIEDLIYGSIAKILDEKPYELMMSTSSGMQLFLPSYDVAYLYRAREAIQEAIASRSSAIIYHFNVAAGTIEKSEATVSQ